MPAGTIGPVCSICEEYEAIASLMNLATYETTRFCAMCGVQLLETVLEALRGADTTPDPEPADPIESDPNYAGPGDQAGDGRDGDPVERTVDLTPPAFPGTEHVVRSTHGHRKTGGAADGSERQPD